MLKRLENRIFEVDDKSFEEVVLEVFHFQYLHNSIYQKYCNYLGVREEEVNQISKIPFLPVEFFKNHEVISSEPPFEKVFTSSGTTGAITSRHFVKKHDLYTQSFLKSFELFYGNISEYCVLALLPAYLEREGSSLVDMADTMIKKSKYNESGFYLYEHDKLKVTLETLEARNIKTLLLGVTFGLLDFADKYSLSLKNTIVMETGGMKGRRKEITRPEMHFLLKKAFGVSEIHSEYGMTELLSQAYSKGNGRYLTPPWMKVMIRDQYDPFSYISSGQTGGVNIIDLANVYSCSFIETKDLGKKFADGSFEILGRFDNSDIRGCNLMIE